MRLVFIGDTQRTFILERFLGREQNDRERESIIRAASTENADAVIFLGDLVAIGALHSDWRYFDRLVRPFTEKNTPLYTVYGNHDYFFDASRARGYMNTRFPHLLQSPWSCLRFGELAVVTIDSNKAVLSAEAWDAQKLWLSKILGELEADTKIRGVILALHHPPFSNSRRSRTSRAVRDEIVPLFLAAPKALALLSGHCHAYERFEISGKTFIVSGGGGGPRAEILDRTEHRHTDLYLGNEVLRPFHYLRLETETTGPRITAMGHQKGETEAKEIDVFTLKYR